MQRVLALGLIVLIGAAVSGTGLAGGQEPRSTALALGLALVAAALAGSLFDRLKLPRICGYLLFGLLCGPYVGNIITRAMARELQVLNGLAVALIAFIAGLELNVERLRPRLGEIVKLSVVAMGLMYVALFAVLFAAWPWLPFAFDAPVLVRFGIVTVLTTLVVSFSPTVTLAVVAESRARGPFTELVLAIVILADLLLILLFTGAMEFTAWAIGRSADHGVGLIPHLFWEIIGSFAFGAILGAAFALYLRFVGREVTLVLIAVCALLSELGPRLEFEPVLAALSAGLVVENIAAARGEALKHAVEAGALPVLIVFFVAAGASLQLDVLAILGWTGLAIAALRLAMLRLGMAVGARYTSLDPAHVRPAWMGLVSQAGVTLGLATIVATEYPDWGAAVQTLIVALTALHVMTGPIFMRAALQRTGEVGAMDAVPDADGVYVQEPPAMPATAEGA